MSEEVDAGRTSFRCDEKSSMLPYSQRTEANISTALQRYLPPKIFADVDYRFEMGSLIWRACSREEFNLRVSAIMAEMIATQAHNCKMELLRLEAPVLIAREVTKQAVEATKQVAQKEATKKSENENGYQVEMERFKVARLQTEANVVQVAKDKKHELALLEAATRRLNAQTKLAKTVASPPAAVAPAEPAVDSPLRSASPSAVEPVAPRAPAASLDAASREVEAAEAPVVEADVSEVEQAEVDIRATYMLLRGLMSNLKALCLMVKEDLRQNRVSQREEALKNMVCVLERYARPNASVHDLQQLLLRSECAVRVLSAHPINEFSNSIPERIQIVRDALAKYTTEHPKASIPTVAHQAAKHRLMKHIVELPALKLGMEQAFDRYLASTGRQFNVDEKLIRAKGAISLIFKLFRGQFMGDLAIGQEGFPYVVVDAAAAALKLLTSIAKFNGDMLDIAPIDSIAAFSIKSGSIEDWFPKLMECSTALFAAIKSFMRASVLPSIMARVEQQMESIVQDIAAARQTKLVAANAVRDAQAVIGNVECSYFSDCHRFMPKRKNTFICDAAECKKRRKVDGKK